MLAAVPADEEARLEALRELEILDSAPEGEFDDLALIAPGGRDGVTSHLGEP